MRSLQAALPLFQVKTRALLGKRRIDRVGIWKAASGKEAASIAPSTSGRGFAEAIAKGRRLMGLEGALTAQSLPELAAEKGKGTGWGAHNPRQRFASMKRMALERAHQLAWQEAHGGEAPEISQSEAAAR